MSVTQAFTNQAKGDFLQGTHQPTDVYKIALYTQAAATLNQDTTAYTATGEVSGGGYTAGGVVLAGPYVVTVDQALNIAYLQFPTNPTWSGSTITADAAMIYNSSKQNKCLGVFTFTSVATVVGTFTCQLPAAGATALLKII